ncbi:hypothetical protein BR93DRAFT_970870 [Coniochaeta sp. PMI_546]|nr:hypothetical protein BR93DRAFT_970870 [Coniochaeta sp. PMI_546]
MSTQYEVEHGIKPTEPTTRRRRQIDMSTFTSHLHNLSPETDNPANTHNNPHATPNPVDLAALYRLLQDQLSTLATTSPDESNRNFLASLFESLESDIASPPAQIQGVPQSFLDTLERVPRKKLGDKETCPICAERYLDDPYALVVELPCHHSHKFDLECVGPWLLSKGTCPLCRKEMGKKKEVVVEKDDEEDEDDMDGMYA